MAQWAIGKHARLRKVRFSARRLVCWQGLLPGFVPRWHGGPQVPGPAAQSLGFNEGWGGRGVCTVSQVSQPCLSTAVATASCCLCLPLPPAADV